MQQYAIIQNNVVINVVEYAAAPTADQLAPFGAGAIAVLSNGAGPGWAYSNGVLTNPIAPPAPPTPTTISSYEFILRFTSSEQSALMAANPLWGVLIAAAGTIDVTAPALVAYLQAAVASGSLTQARADQVLNLAVASP